MAATPQPARLGVLTVTGRRPRTRVLAEGHAFDSFDWREVAAEGADFAYEMEVTPFVVNSSGALQGGLMATLADMVAGSALVKGEGAYQSAFTSDLHISYLAGARVGPVRATAHVLRRGKRTRGGEGRDGRRGSRRPPRGHLDRDLLRPPRGGDGGRRRAGVTRRSATG